MGGFGWQLTKPLPSSGASVRSALIAHRMSPSPTISLLLNSARKLMELQTQAAEDILEKYFLIWLGSFLLQPEAGLPLWGQWAGRLSLIPPRNQ